MFTAFTEFVSIPMRLWLQTGETHPHYRTYHCTHHTHITHSTYYPYRSQR